MATANDVMQSTEPTTDALSPTTIVLQALKKAGVPLTADNIRRYVAGSMRQTGEAGTDLRGDAGDAVRIENPGESKDSTVRASVGKRGGGGGGGRSTRPADLTHGPTNEADWQPTTTSAPASPVVAGQTAANAAARAAVPRVPVTEPPPSSTNLPTAPNAAGPNGEYVGNAQPASGRSMTIDPTAIPGPNNAALPGPRNPALSSPQAALPSPFEQAMIEALSGPQPQGMLPPPPRQITGPPSAPEAPMASPNTPIPMPGAQAPPGLQVENVPMPPPQQTIQAPSADSIPPSGGLSIEDRMMPGRGNPTIQAPSASSMPATTPPVIQETAPSFKRMLGGVAAGAGAGRMVPLPYGLGPILGGIAGAAPEAWNLGKHIIGR